MKDDTNLARNIMLVQTSLFALQAAFFGIMSFIYKYSETITLLFYLTSFALFALITLLLFMLRDRFAFEDGRKSPHINLPNTLTLFRIGSIPTIFFLLMDLSRLETLFVIIPFIAVVFITDFLDGALARSLRQITIIGKYLDSSSDYLLLFFTSVIFLVYAFIPLWFFVLIIIRLAFQAAGITILSIKQKQIAYTISFLGKISIAATMILFVAELVRFSLGKTPTSEIIFFGAEIAAGVIVLASLVEKAFILKKELLA